MSEEQQGLFEPTKELEIDACEIPETIRKLEAEGWRVQAFDVLLPVARYSLELVRE